MYCLSGKAIRNRVWVLGCHLLASYSFTYVGFRSLVVEYFMFPVQMLLHFDALTSIQSEPFRSKGYLLISV